MAAEQRNVGTTPSALEVEALYPNIVRVAERITSSKDVADNKGVGIIIVQGRHVMSDAVLRAAAGDMTFWLHQDDLDQCMMRYLKARHLWKFPEDSPVTIRSHLVDLCATNRGL